MQASTGWSDEKFYLFYHMINYVKFLNFFNEVFICPKLRTTLFFRLDRNCKKIAWAQKQHEHSTKIFHILAAKRSAYANVPYIVLEKQNAFW